MSKNLRIDAEVQSPMPGDWAFTPIPTLGVSKHKDDYDFGIHICFMFWCVSLTFKKLLG